MKCRGLHLTFEAMLGLLILFAILSIPIQNGQQSLHELHILQKQDDLLKLWLSERSFDAEKMKGDFEFVFPNSSGAIEIGEEKIVVGKPVTNNSKIYSASGFMLNENLRTIEIRISIYG